MTKRPLHLVQFSTGRPPPRSHGGTGGTTTPLSLRSFRERIERQPSMFDGDDWGACGCDMDGETLPAGPRVRVPKVERWNGSGWADVRPAVA